MPKGLIALTPIAVMIVLLIVCSVYYGGVSNAPLLFVFVLTAVISISLTRGMPFKERVAVFSRGAGSPNLLLMVWIFMLAGSFAATAQEMGAAEAMVNLTLLVLPVKFALTGLFLAACVTSLCMGTSVGTIVALMPIAAGLADKTGMGLPLVAAAVVGGAFFGDNLSFISDTTIVSTQTQGCKLSDKFRFNVIMVMPAAIIVAILYIFINHQSPISFSPLEEGPGEVIPITKVIPYLTVLICAACGVDVLVVLVIGCALTCITGMLDGSYDLMGWITGSLNGVMGMSELILISMLAGGIFALISHNGGLEYVIDRITRRVKTRAGAEWSICGLVAFANLCTANNTIAILSVGDIARRVAEQYDIDPRRSASLLDTTSCCAQGLLPYGAQLLMAGSLAGISAVSIIPWLFYPMLLALSVIATIITHRH
ncbi:MAG: Na+/H+ antiporter NhaC family protein [Paludibacteraceae bacterium]